MTYKNSNYKTAPEFTMNREKPGKNRKPLKGLKLWDKRCYAALAKAAGYVASIKHSSTVRVTQGLGLR